MKKSVILVDGNHLVRRNFYTTGRQGLSTSSGVPSGAIYGSLKTLRKVIMDVQPFRVVVFFDGGYERASKILPEYKGNRDRSDDHIFKVQCRDFQDVILSLGCLCVRVDGVESDDLIGVCSNTCKKKKYQRILVVSSDKDLLQLVDRKTHLYDDLHSRTVSVDNFNEFYPDLKPKDIVLVKALSGDSSDNIPGLPNVGEKTAIKILQALGRRGFVEMTKKEGVPNVELFNKRDRWRIEKAFVPGWSSLVKRNLRIVRLPRSVDDLEHDKGASYIHQLTAPVEVSMKRAQKILVKYQLKSILGNLETWSKPLVRRHGPL